MTGVHTRVLMYLRREVDTTDKLVQSPMVIAR